MKDYIYSNDSGYTLTQADSISEVRAKLMRKKIHNTKPKKLWWDVKWDRGFGTLTYVGSPIIEWTWTTYADRTHRKPLATYYVNPNGMLGNKLGKKYGY